MFEKIKEFFKEEKSEQENNEEIVDFLTLSQKQENLLRQRIEENQGLIRIFVHPHFEKLPLTISPEKNDRMKVMNLALQRMIALPGEKIPPIFFFEEEGEIPRLERIIKSIGLKNKIYTIPTFPLSPEPSIIGMNQGESEEKNWGIIIEKLKSAGVKKIIIGGTKFLTYVLEPDEVKFLGCVGEAMNRLSRDFDIEVSHLSFPHNRKNFEEIKKRAKKFKREILMTEDGQKISEEIQTNSEKE